MKIKTIISTFLLLLSILSFSKAQTNVELVKNIKPEYLTVFKNKIIFVGYEQISGSELYISDGTAPNTKLLKDIDTRVGYSGLSINAFDEVKNWVITSDKMYFVASDSAHGKELWVTDATTEGTKLVKDISPNTSSSYIQNVIPLPNGKIFMPVNVNNSSNNFQLWLSDGTENGTNSFMTFNNFIYWSTLFKGKIFFHASNSEGGYDIWVTDGTEAGTKLFKKIGTEGVARFLFTDENRFFFSTYNELWVSDGTEAGTKLIKKNESPNNLFNDCKNMVAFKNKYFFSAFSNVGTELWVTDGTEAGTKLFKDLYFNISYPLTSSYPQNFTVLNDKLFFTANTETSGNILWVSDGTMQGTQKLRDDIYVINNQFHTYKNKIYFPVDFLGNIWESDGTTIGTHPVASSQSSNLLTLFTNSVIFNEKLYLGLRDVNRAPGLWSISQNNSLTYTLNFTPNTCKDSLGQFSVKMMSGMKPFQFKLDNLNSQSDSIFKNVKGGTHIINIRDAMGLSISDTFTIPIFKDSIYVALKSFGSDCLVDSLVVFPNGGTSPFMFQLNNLSLNTEGVFKNIKIENYTITVTDAIGCKTVAKYEAIIPQEMSLTTQFVNNCTYDSAFITVTPFKGRAPFQYQVDSLPFVNNSVLKTTATSHTISIKDNRGCIVKQNAQLFWRTPLSIDYDLTRSLPDRTTDLVAIPSGGISPYTFDFDNSGFNPNINYSSLSIANHILSVKDSVGCVVKKSFTVNPFPSIGLHLVKDINTRFPYSSSYPQEFFKHDHQFVFTASPDDNGFSIFASDGTTAGTKAIKPNIGLNTGSGDFYSILGVYNNQCYVGVSVPFTSFRELWHYDKDSLRFLNKVIISNSPIETLTGLGNKAIFAGMIDNDMELWETDGTSSGTKILKNINPDRSSQPNNFHKINNSKLIFKADDGIHGQELWVTDGTSVNTKMLKDIGINNESYPAGYVNFKNKTFFSATDADWGGMGRELWVTDGSPEGTQLFKDFYQGDSNPTIVFSNDSFMYISTNSHDKSQLWKSDGTSEGTILLKDSVHLASAFYKIGDKYVFSGSINNDFNSFELWVTDLTQKGTKLLKKLSKNNSSSQPTGFLTYQDKVYFSANDGINDAELWVTDGTSDGTIRLTDIKRIHPDQGNNVTINIYNNEYADYNNQIYLGLNSAVGTELWRIVDSSVLQATFTRVATGGNCQNLGRIDINATGGIQPYQYQLDSSQFQTSPSFTATKIKHLVTVKDALGSTVSRYVSFTIDTLIVSVNDTCGRNVSLTANVSGGFAPYSFKWNTGAATRLASNLQVGTYLVTVTDACGTKAVQQAQVTSCVWPGDTDSSGTVNHFDLLPLGLFNAQRGQARTLSEQNIGWYGHLSPEDWLTSLPNHPNPKFADTDGNGLIVHFDTSAIHRNWSLEHPQLIPVITQLKSEIPPIYVGSTTQKLRKGFSYSLPINLGESGSLATNVYGIGFSVKYDANIIDVSSINVTFNNSWFGDNSQQLNLFKNFSNNSRIDVALTQLRTNISGHGQVAQLNFKIRQDAKDSILTFSTQNALLINKNAEQLPIGLRTTKSTVIVTSTDDVSWANQINIYPSIFTDMIHIESPNIDIQEIVIRNAYGQIFKQLKPSVRYLNLNSDNLIIGTYFITLKTEKGLITKKIVKVY